mgnify:CR=1 FL=1|jgi:hypothetical protein
MNNNKVTFPISIDWKWTVILIIMCLGEPDIIDGMVTLLHNLANSF